MSSGETKVLCYRVKANTAEELTLSMIAKANNQASRSNVWKNTVLHYDIKANMTTNTESQFVQIDDEIYYNIAVENNGTAEKAIELVDEIPNKLEIKSITVDGKEKDISEITNKVKINTVLGAKTTTNISIKTVVDYHEDINPKTITNKATVMDEHDNEITATSDITHIIKGTTASIKNNEGNDEGQDSDGGNNNNSNNNNDNNNQNATQGTNMIAGVAWLDADSNGRKDTGESLLSNITVKLLNVETNEIVKNSDGNEVTATTNAEGLYLLQNITNGKYIVVFEYDTTKYGLTTYQVSGASESENSNAVMNDLTINGVSTKVASTDIITIENTDASNINIGLVELDNFDLQLEKYIGQVLIQNASGTTVKQYDNVDMAKVELDAKRVNGSTVLIQYNIIVTNVGEVDGYAKKIVDYMPSDLKFSSELNKDWYQTNGQLYNASLANEKIVAGESKTITLTLTKSMTENNTGLTTNAAEIAEDYNELGLTDSNSKPGNKAEGENDMSSAEIIISIRTGGIVYLSIAIIMLAIGSVVAYVMIKKKNKNVEEI